MRRLLIITLIGGCCTVGICSGQAVAESVDLCTLAANVQTYSGHEVRVTAFFAAGRESAVLYDPKCQEGKPLVWVEFKPKVEGQMKTLRRIVEKRNSALVTIEGTMHGGEPVKVDPKLPDWLKDRFKGSSQTYGHLGSFDMMIEIGKVIEAKDVDDRVKPKAAADELRHELRHATVADVAENKL